MIKDSPIAFALNLLLAFYRIVCISFLKSPLILATDVRSIYNMQAAISNSTAPEQRNLLLEGLSLLKQTSQVEEAYEQDLINNSISIKAIDVVMNRKESLIDQVYPLNFISLMRYIRKTDVPAKPIMIARSQSSVVFKMPYYKPNTEYKNWRAIKKMAIFGKESDESNPVTLQDNEYQGTGVKTDPGAVVRVEGLTPNREYTFAGGGYTQDLVCVNGIGHQNEGIVPCLPLNLNLLYSYLAQTSYKLEHYQIAKTAAETVLTQYMVK